MHLLLPCAARQAAVCEAMPRRHTSNLPALPPMPHACCLQMWVLADVERLRQAGAEGGALPHSFHYQSGALGSGLLLLSRYPVAEVRAVCLLAVAGQSEEAAVVPVCWL